MKSNITKLSLVQLIIPLTIIFGVQFAFVLNEVIRNGAIFSLPLILFLSISAVFIFVEFDQRKKLTSDGDFCTNSLHFLRSVFSFETIFNTLFIGFFTLLEIIIFTALFFYSLRIISIKFFNNSYSFDVGIFPFALVVIVFWILSIYLRLFYKKLLAWQKWIKIIKGFVLLCFSFSFLFSSDYLFNHFSIKYSNFLFEYNLFLKPDSVFDSSIWIRGIGQVFVLVVSAYLIFDLYKKYIKIDEDNSDQNFKNYKIQLLPLLLILTLIISSILFFNFKSEFFQVIISFSKQFIGDNLILEIFYLFLILIFIILFSSFCSAIFKSFQNPLIHSVSIWNQTFIQLSTEIKSTILIVLMGLLSGAFFVLVNFDDFYFWIGAFYILILLVIFFLQITFYYNIQFKNYAISIQLKSQMTFVKLKLSYHVLSFVFLILVLCLSPVVITNFFFNKANNEKIEYLQDLGQITSNHYQREPFVFKDYFSIVQAIDSNRIVLDKIDSLTISQKDSLKFYIENRRLKQNENFRLERLQFYHDLVNVELIGKVSLFALCILMLCVYFIEFRKAKERQL